MKYDKNKKVESQETESKEMVWEIVRTGMYMLIAIIIALILREYVVQRTVVDGRSMQTTLEDGDNLFIDKISYRFTEPERFDIVVFPFIENGVEVNYIKRIIGMPNETVQIKKGEIYINDEKLEEDYGLERIKEAGYASSPVTLGEDEYFVIGDNRNNSTDSRSLDEYGNPVVGVVHKDNIIGKAFIRVYPFESFGWIE